MCTQEALDRGLGIAQPQRTTQPGHTRHCTLFYIVMISFFSVSFRMFVNATFFAIIGLLCEK